MAGECVRVAVVVIDGANANVNRDLDAGNQVYLPECGMWIAVVARTTVDRPDLLVLDQTDCLANGHEVSDEEDELFDLGRDLGADIVAYYIQGDTAGFRGCAAHPPGRRGFWVGDTATQWTFAHELTHVVGDNGHVGNTDNLMFRNTGRITNPPPDLTDDQCARIRRDEVMGDCVLAAQGRPTFLRVHDRGTGFGPPDDHIDVEAVVELDSRPDEFFGFQMRDDKELPARQGMLDLLRSAFEHDTPVRLDYRRTGLTTGVVLRAADLP
ncbi:hypothetical protein F4561_005744 [Lipingzhangella halophila]|uniref:Uncharacterized protein n=1 Tax=Lipingzhangella halophila TaxID=1783352 RepID=A0A7W7RMQ4_9ACTN|nr:hypothetical protein [Lipingzhangella halophila]MBB4934850.1 hypothetical protein [Lipingzhangella halophila]